MKRDELKKMSAEELQKELIDLQREHFNLRMQLGSGQLARVHLIKEVKRNIARVKTLLTEKALAGSNHE